MESEPALTDSPSVISKAPSPTSKSQARPPSVQTKKPTKLSVSKPKKRPARPIPEDIITATSPTYVPFTELPEEERRSAVAKKREYRLQRKMLKEKVVAEMTMDKARRIFLRDESATDIEADAAVDFIAQALGSECGVLELCRFRTPEFRGRDLRPMWDVIVDCGKLATVIEKVRNSSVSWLEPAIFEAKTPRPVFKPDTEALL